MEEPRQLLLVAPTADVAEALVAQLASRHALTVVTTFEAAQERLETHPHLLITELKLGEYNGMQLALRVRDEHTPAIVIGTHDTVWEREARQLGVMYVGDDLPDGGMLTLVSHLLDSGPTSPSDTARTAA
jgi:DNA-binding response OmpR family regulator